MTISKSQLVGAKIDSITFNCNIMIDADKNGLADIFDEAKKTRSIDQNQFAMDGDHRKTEAKLYATQNDWLVRVTYVFTKDGKKLIQNADYLFATLASDLSQAAHQDSTVRSGKEYAFPVSQFPDPVIAQADVQSSAEKKSKKKNHQKDDSTVNQVSDTEPAKSTEASPEQPTATATAPAPAAEPATAAPVTTTTTQAPTNVPLETNSNPAPNDKQAQSVPTGNTADPNQTKSATPATPPAAEKSPNAPSATQPASAKASAPKSTTAPVAQTPKPANSTPAAKPATPAQAPTPVVSTPAANATVELVPTGVPAAPIQDSTAAEIKKVITNELAGDFASLTSSKLGLTFNVSAAQAAITDAFVNDLLDSSSSDADKQHMAHSLTGNLFGKFGNNAIAAILVPESKKSSAIRVTQNKYEESYHVAGSYVDCATSNGWTTRGVEYASIMGFGGGPEMRDVLAVSDGAILRPPTQANDSNGLDQCSTETKNASVKTYAIWNLSNHTIRINGQNYYVLIGAISSEEEDAVGRVKMTTGKSAMGTYYPGTLAKFKRHGGF